MATLHRLVKATRSQALAFRWHPRATRSVCNVTSPTIDGYTWAHRLQDLVVKHTPRDGKYYKQCHLHHLNPKTRGDIVEEFCRSIYTTHLRPGSPEPQDMSGELCVNGSRRGRGLFSCDFVAGDRRIEVKSTGLRHKSMRDGRWRFVWCAVKRDAFDQLLLCGYTPGESWRAADLGMGYEIALSKYGRAEQISRWQD
jgi:hypothetical protein